MKSKRYNKIQLISPPAHGSQDELRIDRITEQTGTEGLSISFVSFPSGTRRPWSSHNQDQYVWTIKGTGQIASEYEELILEPGMIVFIPAGLRHQHGAVEGEPFTQLSIIGGNPPSKRRMTLNK